MTHSQQTIIDYTLEQLRPFLAICGDFYPSNQRPLNSTKEDCVVGFLSGNADQVQEGYVVVNIYVPMLFGTDGVYYHDRRRCTLLEQMLSSLPDSLNPQGDVRYTLFGMAHTMTETTNQQSVVSAQYRFKFLTE